MKVIRGKATVAGRTLVYGPPGVGKSTLACSAPGALALDYEHGLNEIGPDRVDGAESWPDSLALVREACAVQGGALAIDTIDSIEDQAIKMLCKKAGKESLSDFGYGKGDDALLMVWRELLAVLETARANGREVILVAHVQSKDHKDPMLGSYAKNIAQLRQKTWGATHRWCDNVLFLSHEAGLTPDGRAVMTGRRVLYTQAGSGFDAKNRWGLPAMIDLTGRNWSSVVASRRSPSAIRVAIEAATSLLDAPTQTRVMADMVSAKDDVETLLAIETAVKEKLS